MRCLRGAKAVNTDNKARCELKLTGIRHCLPKAANSIGGAAADRVGICRSVHRIIDPREQDPEGSSWWEGYQCLKNLKSST